MMTDTPSVNPTAVVKLGTVAAQNIAQALNLGSDKVAMIERAVSDEINAMSAHFTLAFADIQTSYEIETAKLKKDYDVAVEDIRSAFTYIEANGWRVLGYTVVVFALGAIAGHIA